MNSYEVSNPAFNTAKLTLYWLSRSGNEIAATFLARTGFDENFGREKIPFFDAMALPNTVGQEVRYLAVNRLIRQSGAKSVLDLGCGFSPRGLDLSREGYTYCGGDLQMVVPVLEPIVKELAAERADRVHYAIVDVTNRASVDAAADRLNGPLAVVTEGLMAYLNHYEKKTLCENIAALLRRRGGCYITPDFNSNVKAFALARATVGEEALQAVLASQSQFEKGGDVKTDVNLNLTDEQTIAIFNEAGLDVQILPLFTEDMAVRAFSLVDPEKLEATKACLADCTIWYCTLWQDAKEARSERTEAAFSAVGAIRDGVLSFRLAGRLDSLTAPKLFDAYTAVADADSFGTVRFDFSALEYISSAGLRVLLSVQKRSAARKVIVCGCNETVRSVLTQTGFDTILTVEE